MSIRLVAVDEHTLLRLGLARVVTAHPEIEMVGEAGSAADALRVVEETQPAVVTMGLSLPDGDGIVVAERLREYRPNLGVVLLAEVADDALLYRALDARLSAYVTKSAPVQQVLAAIRHASVAPTSFTTPGLSAALSRRQTQGGLLSRRERQVLSLMRDGISLPAMAVQLQVSEATVKTYVSRLYSKLRVNNRSQALMVAVNQGLLAAVDAA